MNQFKFSLGLVFMLLTAVCFGYICFLGLNFYTLGDKFRSIIISLIIVLLLIGTAFGASLLKKTTRNFKTCRIWEGVLISFFTLLMICFTYFPYSHYFDVSVKKNLIQTKLNANISQAENMYREYENYVTGRHDLYREVLISVAHNKNEAPAVYNSYEFSKINSVSDETQIKNKHFKIKALLLPSNFTSMKTTDSTWLAKARISVTNWDAISLVDVINSIETNSTNSLKQLVHLSEQKALKEDSEKFALSDELKFENVKSYFTTMGTPTPLAIATAFLAYLLMLLSWLITKRDTRGTGALTTAKYEVVL